MSWTTLALIVVGMVSVRPALAQDAQVADAPTQLDVQRSSDGRVALTVSNVALDQVIRSVAAAGGVQVKTIGSLPRDLVSGSFNNFPDVILTELMDRASINYIMSRNDAIGASNRLLMVGPTGEGRQGSSGQAATWDSPRPLAVEAPVDVPLSEPPASAADPASTPRDDEVTEWPSGIEPVNLGPPAALPLTEEELLLQVNGGAIMDWPAGSMSPNMGPPLRPDQIEPVNPRRATASVPGVIIAPPLAATPNLPGVAGGATGPSGGAVVMQAPPTYRVPGPVVVYFPPKPKS